jgi:hypothetical protein
MSKLTRCRKIKYNKFIVLIYIYIYILVKIKIMFLVTVLVNAKHLFNRLPIKNGLKQIDAL